MNKETKDIKETREHIMAKAEVSADVSADIMTLLAEKNVPLDIGLASLASVLAIAGADNNVDKDMLIKRVTNTINVIYATPYKPEQ